MEIRSANANDLDACVGLAVEFHEVSVFRDMPLDRLKIYERWIAVLRSLDQAACAFVAEVENEVAGVLFGSMAPYWFADGMYAQDLGFFVRRGEVRSPVALGLLRAYVEWAQERGAREARVERYAGVELSDAGDLLRGLGFVELGSFHSIRLG